MMRKQSLCLMIYLTCCLTFQAQAEQARELCGRVALLGKQDERIPVNNVTVRIEETGNADLTTDSGAFCLQLPDIFKSGELITLAVEHEGYQILRPFGGKVRIPAELRKERVTIELDELGSHRFMSREAFALLIEKIANEAKEQVPAADQEPQDIDLSRYLKDWAVKYGFGLDDVRTELDAWAAEVEANYDNLYELGLAAFYRKHFREAAEKFLGSAEHHEKELEEVLQKEQDLRSKVIRDYRLAGDAYYNAYQFQDALNAYQKALAEVDKETDSQQWASLMMDISNTCQNLGIRIGGESGQMQLANAVAGYRAIFTVYTRATLPQQWATTQNNLGNALKEQALMTTGEQTQQRLLHEAIDALHNASEVYTYKDIPGRWAIVQQNLAETYFKIGDSFNGLQCFIPLLFVTKRFAAVNEILTEILPNIESVPQLDIPLRAIEIATLLAQRKPEEIPAKLQTLIATLQEQPEDFRLDWNFNEMKQFISTSDVLRPSRDWLLAFFNTLEADHRDAILQGLHAVQKEFDEMALN